jgi:ABC-type nitrate/sulfonate/bicarbonate transport system substrate-binding protein
MKITVSLALLLAQVLVCGQTSHAQEKIRLGISAVSLGFLPTILAEKKGFYAKYGLMPEHVLVACAIATNALLSEDLDYAVCTGPGVSGAIKGLPIKLVVTTQDKLGYFILVRPEFRS